MFYYIRLRSTYFDNLRAALAAAEQKSITYGHWRTGLMAGNTATNIAGAVISHKNKNDGGEIKDMAAACLESVDKLRLVSMQALFDGSGDASLLARASKIVDACGKYNVKDLEKIPKWQDVAKWTSIVGIGTGAVGTTTSIIANTEKVRHGDKDTEKNLNLASNILAGASTVASGIATGFNIATVAGISRIASTAQNCEEALQ